MMSKPGRGGTPPICKDINSNKRKIVQWNRVGIFQNEGATPKEDNIYLAWLRQLTLKNPKGKHSTRPSSS